MSTSCIECKKDYYESRYSMKCRKKAKMACSGRGMEIDLRDREGDTIGLTSVTIDFHELIKPLVKIDFSGVVEFEAIVTSLVDPGLELELQFILSRICEDGVEEELERYNYLRAFDVSSDPPFSALLARTTDPISFTFCDSVNSCLEGPCTYVVRVFASTVRLPEVIVARINDTFVNAIAQGLVPC